jgi:hypothetical protein
LNDTRRFENGEPIPRIEPAKEIARKQRGLHVLDSIRPALSARMEREEQFITLPFQKASYASFVLRPNVQCEPG